jgi:hypothetical protein
LSDYASEGGLVSKFGKTKIVDYADHEPDEDQLRKRRLELVEKIKTLIADDFDNFSRQESDTRTTEKEDK